MGYDLVGFGLFHVNFWEAFLQRVKRRGRGDEHSSCWSHRWDLHSIPPRSFLLILFRQSLPRPTPQRVTAFPSNSSTDSWYFDRRSQLKNFRNKQLWEKRVFVTIFLDVLQLHNTKMRWDTSENNLFFFPHATRSILNINVCDHSHVIATKINGFFRSHLIVFNSMCTQIYV